MSADKLTVAQRTALSSILHELCSLAHSSRVIAAQCHEADEEEKGGLLVAARVLSDRSGFLADRAIRLLGEPGAVGDDDEWLLPPRARQALQAAGGPKA